VHYSLTVAEWKIDFYWDPKDGELCLNRVKPEETLVEARSGSNVQIDRQILA
jgi:hypothetical protein